MAIEKTTVAVCDNPACRARNEHSKEEPAEGYHLGKGYWVFGGGGPIPAVYACSKECLTPAIDAVIQESLK